MYRSEYGKREIQHFMNEDEYLTFSEIVHDLSETDSTIEGVLVVGSLMQSPGVFPANHFDSLPGKMGQAYDIVRRPERRKFGYSETSDLDIWVCTEDVVEGLEHPVNQKGIQLLGMAALDPSIIGTKQWSREKWERFSEYYKNPLLYAQSKFICGSEPWMAERFKAELERMTDRYLPRVTEIINTNLTKKIPGKFLEIRAYPKSLFNLRPDEHHFAGDEDRNPFPRIADSQWISRKHNADILYESEGIDIYPFREDGRVLGQDMKDEILARAEQGELDNEVAFRYGAVFIKPDAVKANQSDLIIQKVADSLPEGCNVVGTVEIENITEDQVREMYYSLDSEEFTIPMLHRYLDSGPSILVVVSGNGSTNLISALNAIKGRRPGDWQPERLCQGRKLTGTIRDLLPLPGDEEIFERLIPKIIARQQDPNVRFTSEEYAYYSQNLVHTPGDTRELLALLGFAKTKLALEYDEN